MPSNQTLPGIADFVAAGHDAVRGDRDRYADARTGSLLDHVSGPMAILFARQVERDQQLFRGIYLDDADGDELTALIEGRFGIPRALDTYGTGTCQVVRANALGGAGPFLAGTRIRVPSTPETFYCVAADTAAGPSDTSATLPVRAMVLGSESAFSGSAGLSFEDPVYDPLWTPRFLECAAGADYEPANEYRARVRQLRLAARNGYVPRLILACQNAGATYVIAFPSQYGLQANDFDGDFGLNALYVADAQFQSNASLVTACSIAVESVRVLGADLWVGGIAARPLTINAVVNLVDDPGKFDIGSVERALVQALLAYFSATQSGYLYKRSAMEGACANAHPAVQRVTFTSPAGADPVLLPSAWPATLTRWTLAPQNIALTFAPPV